MKKIEILGIPVDHVNRAEAEAAFVTLLSEGASQLKWIATPNSEIIVNAQKDAAFADVLRSADLVIPDGIGLVYASKLLGCPLKERVTGIDFLSSILAHLAKEHRSVFLLGSKPGEGDEPGVAQAAAAKMREAFPGLVIAGTHHGYFEKAEEEEVVEKINASHADFLCVALGSPKQEQFIAKHKTALSVKVAIGVGGSLDVWAGTVKRAPKFYQDHGVEWLYRFVKQPSRYKRMAAIPLFMLRVLVGGKK